MKKFLSLVLALVMTMSLVTVGAGAADFTDDSSITYKEAVDVMTALGVVGGYADGSFGPKGTLTRGAAAKIICNLILGSTTADALVADTAPYSDVPTDNVFAGYIAYLAKTGIVGGYADGTFRPGNVLTGYAFMKMLLGVIGLDAAVEGYNEGNWSIAVAKRALSEDVDLTDGLVGAFNGTKVVTREEACLYAFNALKAAKFSYENKSTIVVGNVSVSNTSEAEQKKKAYIDDEDGDYVNAYFKEVFPKLERATVVNGDDFGRPAHEWTYDGDDIGTYADTAKYTVVLTDDYKADVDILDELQDLTGNNKLAFKKDSKSNDDVAIYVNGVPVTKLDDYVKKTYGMTLELFCSKNTVNTVVAYYYSVAKISDVDDNVTKADKKDDVTCYVDLKGVDTIKDTDIVGFDAKTYVEDAWIAYIAKNLDNNKKDTELIDSFVVEEVEGSLDTIKGNDYVTMDGTKYYVVKMSGADVSELNTGSDNTYKLFLDKNGNIIGTDVVEEDAAGLDEVYYVTKVWAETDGKYESEDSTYYAQLVDLTGEVSEVKLENLDKNDEPKTETTYKSDDYVGALVTISDKKWTDGNKKTHKANDGKYDLTVWSNKDYDAHQMIHFGGWEFTKSMTRFTMSNAAKTTYRFNDKTQYVLIDGTNADVSAKVKVGGIALECDSDMIGYIVTEDDSMVALYVVIYDTNEIEEGNTYDADNLIYIKSVSSEKNKDYYVQTVYLADGSKEEWKIDASEYKQNGALYVDDDNEFEGKFFEYDTNDDGYYELNAASKLNTSKLENGVWDDEEGVLYGKSYAKGALYEDLLSFSDIADIDVSKAAFVDLHDTDEEYSRTVKSLTALDDLFEKDGYTTSATLNLSVSEDGAVLIVVTNLTHVKNSK